MPFKPPAAIMARLEAEEPPEAPAWLSANAPPVAHSRLPAPCLPDVCFFYRVSHGGRSPKDG